MLHFMLRIDAGSRVVSEGAGLELSAELRREWLRLVAALREGLHAAVDLDAAPARMRELASQAAAFSKELRAHARGCPVPLHHARPESLEPEALNAFLPFSPVMGRYNPLAPPVEFRLEGERVIGTARLREAFQGASGIVHGGIVSSVFDEALALATLIRGVPGPTVSLTVRYLAPTPILEELRFESWVDRVKRRRVLASARCLAGGKVIAEAEGVFGRPGPTAGWIRRLVPAG